MTDNVIDIPPAKFTESFGGHTIYYAYVPSLQKWHWQFQVVIDVLTFENVAPSRIAAIAAAHREVNKVNK